MFFTSPTSTISSVSSMSSTASTAQPLEIRPRTASTSSRSSFSSSGLSAWPYKSSLINATSSEQPSSYLSDEDLCFSSEEDVTVEPEVELSTEEQIERMRKAAEQQPPQLPYYMPWNQPAGPERKSVRFSIDEPRKKSRSSPGKRRKSIKKVVFVSPAAV